MVLATTRVLCLKWKLQHLLLLAKSLCFLSRENVGTAFYKATRFPFHVQFSVVYDIAEVQLFTCNEKAVGSTVLPRWPLPSHPVLHICAAHPDVLVPWAACWGWKVPAAAMQGWQQGWQRGELFAVQAWSHGPLTGQTKANMNGPS